MSSHQNDPYGLRTDPVLPRPDVPTAHPESDLRPPTTGSSTSASDVTASVAGPASDVKDAAVMAGSDVARTAKEEAGAVVHEAKQQGRQVLDEGLTELRSQAAAAQSRLADTVQALSDELRAMAASPDANGPLTDLVDQGRDLSERAAAWLRDNDPDQALVSVRRYAARNPWTFLALAGGAGLLAGRFARGLSAASDDEPTVRRVDRAPEPRPFAGPEVGSPDSRVTDRYPDRGYQADPVGLPADDVYGVTDDLASRPIPRPSDLPGGGLG